MPPHPLGCKVQAFNDTKTRRSWEEQSKDGFYIGTSPNHYRTYDVWIPQTRATQNCDTVFFQHRYITRPTVTKADVVTDAAHKLIKTVKGNYMPLCTIALNSRPLFSKRRCAKSVELLMKKRLNRPQRRVKSTSPRVGQEDEKVEVPTPSPSPRVGNTQASPRVEAGGSPFDSSIPNLIPADDDKSDSESDSDEDGIECNDEPPPLYIVYNTASYRQESLLCKQRYT